MPHPEVFVLVVNCFGSEAFNVILGPCEADYKSPEMYVRQWIEENRQDGTDLTLEKERQVVVRGVPGYEFVYNTPSRIVHKKVSFANKGHEYVIDYGTSSDRFARYEHVFDRITESFEWL